MPAEVPVFTELKEVPAAEPVEKTVADTVVAEPEKPEPRTYTQEDLDRITAKVKKNERYRTRKEVEAFYQGRESAAPKPEPQKTNGEAKAPTRDQYDSYEAFLEAKAEFVAEHAAEKRLAKMDTETTERKAKEDRAKVTSEFQERARAKFPDMDERIAEIGEMPMYEGVQTAIAESQFGPEILNELVSKPTELERLSKMTQTAAIREIGKLEARFEAAAPKKPDPTAAPAAEKPSQAPEPIKPVGAKEVKGDVEPSTDKTEAWMAWRQRQLQAKRKGVH